MNAKKLFLMVMVVLCTIVCAFSQQYKIGDEGPGGGIVFYYSEKGFDVYEADGSVTRCNYLEVSKTEVACTHWCRCEGLTDEFCFVNTGDSIGMGKMNTYKIIKAYHKTNTPMSVEYCAAKACAEYFTEQTVRGEWFLPSKNELYILYKNLKERILALASRSRHWTSSQFNRHNSGAYDLDFSNGEWREPVKGFQLSIRAIRAF